MEANPLTLGLYALKPWYARRLVTILDRLDPSRVTPNAVSAAGVVAGAVGGLTLAIAAPGVVAAVVVALAAAARLACANLDGGLARRRGATSRWGGLVNEVTDRLADLALLAGLGYHLGGRPPGCCS